MRRATSRTARSAKLRAIPQAVKDALFRRLTPAEEDVARCIAEGWTYSRIADHLDISRKTVSAHVAHIAMKIDNPDDLMPHELVLLWAAHRKWIARDEAA